MSEAQFFGEVTHRAETAGAVVSCLRHRVARRLPMHSHASAFFTLLVRGGYREENGRDVIDYKPMTVVFHPSDSRHRDEIGPSGALFLVVESVYGPVTGRSAVEPRATLAALRAFHALTTEDALALEASVFELSGTFDGAKEEDARPQWLRTAVELVHDGFQSSLTVAAVARQVGVHPVHLARVYRSRFGEGVGDTVRRLRIRWAAERMTIEPQRPLADIAVAAGFADQSHFTRAFRAETGVSPAASRREWAG